MLQVRNIPLILASFLLFKIVYSMFQLSKRRPGETPQFDTHVVFWSKMSVTKESRFIKTGSLFIGKRKQHLFKLAVFILSKLLLLKLYLQ